MLDLGDRPLILSDFLAAERDAVLDGLAGWVRIPSISAQPNHARDVAASAHWCADRMVAAGLHHVDVLPTAGHPAVYGDWLRGDGDITVLVYGHHDVQPVDPLDEWDTAPFEPTVRAGRLIGRGASDDKGQVLCHLEAIRGLLGRHGPGALPANVKVLVEGEEEVGSPNFAALLEAERQRLACDLVVVSDSSMWSPEVPSITTGMRSLVAFDVRIRTARRDLHSGVFGGAVPNAAHWAARLVARLHDASGRVALPGFYDAVRPVGSAERAVFAALPLDESAWMATASVGCLEGEVWGSGPEEALGRVLGVPVLHLGVGLASDRIHAPNEGVDLDQVGRGVLAAAELWRELAGLPC